MATKDMEEIPLSNEGNTKEMNMPNINEQNSGNQLQTGMFYVLVSIRS